MLVPDSAADLLPTDVATPAVTLKDVVTSVGLVLRAPLRRTSPVLVVPPRTLKGTEQRSATFSVRYKRLTAALARASDEEPLVLLGRKQNGWMSTRKVTPD